MARAVSVPAESQAAAEQQVRDETPQVRILRSREIDRKGLPSVAGLPVPRHWAVVVEHVDPEIEAMLPQHDDPETACERQFRQLYLTLATKPQLLVTGSIEQFSCPGCKEQVQIQRPPSHQRPDSGHADCPNCGIHLVRFGTNEPWQVFQPPKKQRAVCITCGEYADSMEHVIPEWISKRLGIKTFLVPDDPPRPGDTGRRSQPVSFASYRSRIFCQGCNGHFKHLEDAVIPLLAPMARGTAVSLEQDSQELLSRWAVKTGIAMVAAATPGIRDGIPAEHTKAIRSDTMPADAVVSFFAWDGDPAMSVRAGPVSSRSAPGRDRRAWAALLAFAEIGFFVAGFDVPTRGDERLDGSQPPLEQFWPPSSRLIHWPPQVSADERLLRITDHFVPIRRLR